MASAKQKPAIALRPLGNKPGATTFEVGVSLWGIPPCGRIELSFVEINSGDDNGQADRVLGTAAGTIVFIADWSFQPMQRLTRLTSASPGHTIGAQLVTKATAKSDLLVAVHSWNHTVHWAPDSQNDDADKALTSIARSIGLPGRPANLLWRATAREGSGWSHHQKFVVVDCPGDGGRRALKVFFGGLDLTKGRFDWPQHFLSAKHREQEWPFDQSWGTADKSFEVDDWYNAEFADDRSLPRQPWHDIKNV